MFGFLSRHLSWKLFASYLIVIVVSVLVLGVAAKASVPSAFDRHMGDMGGRNRWYLFRLGAKDSNLHIRIQSPLSYR